MTSIFSKPTPRRTAVRRPLPEQMASYIREQIMSGTLRPGQFIRLEPIAEAQGVSITPVREALVSLVGDGFVKAVPRRGFMVQAFSRQDVEDLFWTQGQLSGELASRAATHITDQELAQLEEFMLEGEAAVARGDADAAGDAGHRFHRVINLAAQSNRLARLLASVVKHLPPHFYASVEGSVRDAPHEHRAMYAALAAHDSDRARALTEAHITAHARHVIEMLEERGLWDEMSERSD